MRSTSETPDDKESDSMPPDAELTKAVKERHVGWIEDPIADLHSAVEAFERNAKTIDLTLLLSLFVSTVGFVASLILFMLALDFFDAELMCLTGIPSVVFFVLIVNAIRSGSFVGVFTKRLRVLATALSYDPRPEIPEGKDPVDRFLKHLEMTDDRYSQSVSKSPQKLRLRPQLVGKSGRSPSFDAHLLDKGGWKRSRYHMLLRVFDKEISRHDLERYKHELEDVLSRLGPPTRVFAIQTHGELNEDAIEFSDSEWLIWKSDRLGPPIVYRSKLKGCPIELVRETEDGTYEFGIFYFG